MFGLCLEASHQRGLGHLFRALNLAEEMGRRGRACHMFVNDDQAAKKILAAHRRPFSVVDIERMDWQREAIQEHGITLWIDDRLNTTEAHAKIIGDNGIPHVSFDDRGTGAAHLDLNIAGLALDPSEVIHGKKILRGIQFLVLNPEIVRYRRQRQGLGSIVVSLGGSDTYGVTIKVVKALKRLGKNATVILGPAFMHDEALMVELDERFLVKRSVPSLPEEFSHHDFAITGGGLTPFEANAAGLPCAVIANEDFEEPIGKGVAALGGAVFLGHHRDFDERLLTESLPIAQMSRRALEHIDLLGAQRVMNEIEALL